MIEVESEESEPMLRGWNKAEGGGQALSLRLSLGSRGRLFFRDLLRNGQVLEEQRSAWHSWQKTRKTKLTGQGENFDFARILGPYL